MKKSTRIGFSIFGIVGPVFLVIFGVVVGFFWPTYNPITNYVSDLAATTSPVRYVFAIVGFGIFGIILIGFCFVLSYNLIQNYFTKTATRLFLAGSLFLVLLGIFPTDLQNAPRTLDGQAHTIFGSFAFLMLSSAMIWYGLAFGKDKNWDGFWESLSVTSGTLALVFGILVELNPTYIYVGTLERLGIGTVLAWIFFVSINLFLKERFEI
jgi:hypothetical membrane protein